MPRKNQNLYITTNVSEEVVEEPLDGPKALMKFESVNEAQ